MPTSLEHSGGGPIYFAWVEESEDMFGVEHHRYDEYILSFERRLEEGKLPTLTVEMPNPGALLAYGQKQWCWFAYDNGSEIVPLFRGRVVASPTDLFVEVVTLTFVARPVDYEEQKAALAASLKASPYWDEVFVDDEHLDDPDAVLEAYSKLWHIDPVTHVVTVTDVLEGEDGVETLSEDDVPYDSVKPTIGQPPLKQISVDATVTWTQTDTGLLAPITVAQKGYALSHILSGWPKPGTSIGTGYTVDASEAVDANRLDDVQMSNWTYAYKNNSSEHTNGDTLTHDVSISKPVFHGASKSFLTSRSVTSVVGDPDTGKGGSTSVQENTTYIGEMSLSASMTLRYNAQRDRTEHLRFTLGADLQDILFDADQTDTSERLQISGRDVGKAIGEDDPPISNLARRSYFPTARGLQSLQHCILRARAHIRNRSRAVSVACDCEFDRSLELTLRQNGFLRERRLPGEYASGKFITIVNKGNGDTGEFIGQLTMGCAIGNETAVEAVGGTPTYVEEDCLGPDTQFYEDRFVLLSSNDVGYTVPVDAPADDGLVFPLSLNQVLISKAMEPSLAPSPTLGVQPTQPAPGLSTTVTAASMLTKTQEQMDRIIADMEAKAPTFRIELKPVQNGPFETAYDIDVGVLSLPRMIDLTGANTV